MKYLYLKIKTGEIAKLSPDSLIPTNFTQGFLIMIQQYLIIWDLQTASVDLLYPCNQE
jgi:hypothetical protein